MQRDSHASLEWIFFSKKQKTKNKKKNLFSFFIYFLIHLIRTNDCGSFYFIKATATFHFVNRYCPCMSSDILIIIDKCLIFVIR